MACSLLSVVHLLATLLFIWQIDRSECDLPPELFNEMTQNSPCSDTAQLRLPETNITLLLKKHLFEHYDKMMIPATNKNPVQMKINMIFSAIDLNYKNSSMLIDAWMKAEWIDTRLTWDAGKYDHTKAIEVKHSKIWLPDFSPNNIKPNDAAVYVLSTGKVLWTQPEQFIIHFQSHLKHWPFDTQTGVLKIGSMMYNDCELNLIETTYSIVVNSSHSKMRTLNVSSQKILNSNYPGNCYCNAFYLKYNIITSLNSPLFFFVVGFPALIIAMLNVVAFWFLPGGDLKAIPVCVASTLLVGMNLSIVYSQIPLTLTNVPLIVKFLMGSLVLTIHTVLKSVVDYKLMKLARPPKFIVELFKFLRMVILDEDFADDECSMSNLKLNGRQNIYEVINKILLIIFLFVYLLLFLSFIF